MPGHGAPKNEAEARTMARNDAAAKHLAEHLHEVAAGLPFFTKNRYGPTNRRAVEDVTFDEKWGRRWEPGT